MCRSWGWTTFPCATGKTEEDLKAARYAWYNKAEVCSFGPQFKEACDELTDEWYRFSVVDLSQHTQVFDMIANDTWHLGYVTVTVDGDWAQVDYSRLRRP